MGVGAHVSEFIHVHTWVASTQRECMLTEQSFYFSPLIQSPHHCCDLTVIEKVEDPKNWKAHK